MTAACAEERTTRPGSAERTRAHFGVTAVYHTILTSRGRVVKRDSAQFCRAERFLFAPGDRCATLSTPATAEPGATRSAPHADCTRRGARAGTVDLRWSGGAQRLVMAEGVAGSGVSSARCGHGGLLRQRQQNRGCARWHHGEQRMDANLSPAWSLPGKMPLQSGSASC